ncbi:hypothetical protein ETD85_20845 [Nonomuraea zeae]|uniref:Uncharacterized protein n=1 Tax=Nonomuraea zeae TaxID=1642303 RepID=A0A5S4GJD6_9ACTN|nr:hypothetical protein [Nonomuraea zeae]TMR33057.1 hypothetical protein ETD85_20845 [Nonomuraea zeae]
MIQERVEEAGVVAVQRVRQVHQVRVGGAQQVGEGPAARVLPAEQLQQLGLGPAAPPPPAPQPPGRLLQQPVHALRCQRGVADDQAGERLGP